VKTRITKTLLDSWAYMCDHSNGEPEKRDEFITLLKREQTPPNEAQQAGLDFERLVQEIAEGRFTPEWVHQGGRCEPNSGEPMGYNKYPKNYNGAVKVADIVKGGQWQVHVAKDITVDGHDFWLHGFCDVVKAGVIYDLKFKTKSFGDNNLFLAGSSFKHSSQHSAYLRCLPEAYEFVYLVSDGEDLYTEAYSRMNSRPIEEIISEFMTWMKTEPELLKLYEERWVVE